MSMKKVERAKLKERLLECVSEKQASFSVKSFAEKAGVSVQTIYKMLEELISEGLLSVNKKAGRNEYSLISLQKDLTLSLEGIDEDQIWKKEVSPFFSDLADIPRKNLHYAFTEVLNNAIDHSEGTEVAIGLEKNAVEATISISDNGIGIFKKIADAMHLEEKSFSILELAKGKFTTDPESHSGEGIFFSSKVVDMFIIQSDDLIFFVTGDRGAGLIDRIEEEQKGTAVFMGIKQSHKETSKEVFDRFTLAPDDYGFSKTIVPVRLLEYGDDTPQVVSRSQAKRLMVRFERFENIILDFTGIEEIGQGFADELFRVFAFRHPKTKLLPINTSKQIDLMIRHVRGGNN